jgi:hypothetical protein
MRTAFITTFPLLAMILISGCGSSAKQTEAPAENPKAAAVDARAEFQKRCGDPVRFPLSKECEQLAGDRGATLRQQSDLTVAIWRACALIPSSAETIRQEIVARGGSRSEVGQRMIGEMERTEQHSDSPCVAADLRDLDCVAGNSDACARVRDADPGCVAWINDQDTQSRIKCIARVIQDPACASSNDSASGNSASDSDADVEDCHRRENVCLHTFDECANAKDALQSFIKQSASREAQQQQPQK